MKREVEVWKSWNPNVMCGLGFEIEDWMKDEQEDSESDADFFSFHVVVLS
jgi:hypothetical protein